MSDKLQAAEEPQEQRMKTLYIVGGTMGAGKTTVCRIINNTLPRSVFLDGDWCWDMHPFQLTPQTKRLVTDNICYLLNSFLRCDAFQNVVFCWVLHEQAIIDGLLSRLELGDTRVKNFSLVCDERQLRQRLQADVASGLRQKDVIERSVARLPQYAALDTVKIDVSNISAAAAAAKIIAFGEK